MVVVGNIKITDVNMMRDMLVGTMVYFLPDFRLLSKCHLMLHS